MAARRVANSSAGKSLVNSENPSCVWVDTPSERTSSESPIVVRNIPVLLMKSGREDTSAGARAGGGAAMSRFAGDRHMSDQRRSDRAPHTQDLVRRVSTVIPGDRRGCTVAGRELR